MSFARGRPDGTTNESDRTLILFVGVHARDQR